MKIVKRRNPFSEIERFFDDQDFFGFVPAVRRHMDPPMDVYQTADDLVVEMHVPRLNPEDVKVTVEDGMLKIEGAHAEEKEDEGKEYYRKEIRMGSFDRMMSLPVPVKEDEIKATYEKGILKVVLPKTEAKKPKQINVEVK